MRRVILESPFAGKGETAKERLADEAENIRYARACVRDCLSRGESALVSHLLFTQPGILDDGIPEERQLGIDAGLAWGEVADATVVYTDRGLSRGMAYGMAKAVHEGRPVELRELGGQWKQAEEAA